jgi:hypothetical protein
VLLTPCAYPEGWRGHCYVSADLMITYASCGHHAINFSGLFALRGTFVHAPVFGEVDVLEDHICIVSSRLDGGKILSLLPAADASASLSHFGLQECTVYTIPVQNRDYRNSNAGDCLYRACIWDFP